MSESPTEPTPERRPDAASAEATPALPATPPAADEAPTEALTEASTEAPSEAAPGVPARPGWSRGRVLVVGILVLVLGAGAGFLLGRSTADSGPTTLAAAVDQTVKGDLPAGDLSLDQLLGAARQRLGSGDGGLGGLLGGNGQGGGNGVLGQILDRLGEQLGNRFGGGSTTPDRSGAFLGSRPKPRRVGSRVRAWTRSRPTARRPTPACAWATSSPRSTAAAVADPAALVRAVSSHQPGDQITLTLTHDGASTDMKVRLGNTDTSKRAPATTPTTRTT